MNNTHARGDDRTDRRGLPDLAAGALVFGTAAAVLVLEILGSRLLAPYVGVTLQTYTAIIGTVLAGISLGTFLGGRAADRLDPHQLLGPLLGAGGAAVLLILPIIRTLGAGSRGVGGAQSFMAVVLALGGLALPAAVLSAVSPTVVKLQLSDLHSAGGVVGRLSAIGTAGAIFGTFVTGFLLVATRPTSTIIIGLGLALVVAGLIVHLTIGRIRGVSGALPRAILIVALVGGGATAIAPRICDTESSYYCIDLRADPQRSGGTFLWFDNLAHSYVDQSDLTYLHFEYVRQIAGVIDGVTDPKEPVDAIALGGGGFTLPRFLAADRPGSTSKVLEVDPTVLDINRQRLGLVTGPQLDVVIGDGRTSIEGQADEAFDVVIGDAFSSESVPWHLSTREFVQEIHRTMRSDGVYVMNIIDFGPLNFVRAEVATLRSVFSDVLVLSRPPSAGGVVGGNVVVVAAKAPVDVERVGAAVRARQPNSLLQSGAEVATFADGAQVLTDDFAPVDRLLTTYEQAVRSADVS